jgi:hypothetical protein
MARQVLYRSRLRCSRLLARPVRGPAGRICASYDKFPTALPANAYSPAEPPGQLSFNNLPKLTTDAGGSYTFTLPEVEANFELAGDWSWQCGEFFNTQQGIVKACGMLNASLDYTRRTVSLRGCNLQNTYALRPRRSPPAGSSSWASCGHWARRWRRGFRRPQRRRLPVEGDPVFPDPAHPACPPVLRAPRQAGVLRKNQHATPPARISASSRRRRPR